MSKRKRAREAPFEIPRELVIGGEQWLVLFDRDLEESPADFEAHLDMADNLGMCLPEEHEIHVRTKRLSPWSIAETFLHEILHACSDGVISAKQEEAFILNVERKLLEVLKQLRWRAVHPLAERLP